MKKILFPIGLLVAMTASAQGGEDCATATTIPSLPYSNSGTTASSTDNYSTVCADATNSGGGKDRVYKYTTGTNPEYVNISLCVAVTNFDSQLYVYESTCSGTPYACREDGCQSPAYSQPYNSFINDLMLNPSTTYYIVVDGWSTSSSGAFQLDVTVASGPAAPTVPFIDATSSLPTSVFHSGNAVGVADMNNDGLDDIVRPHNNTTMYIDYQQAGGTFTETAFTGVTIGDPWGMCIGDMNNDGFNDVLYGDGATTYILTSSSGTSFTSNDVSTTTGAGFIFVQGANFFDINNDGDLDAFVCDDVAMSHIYVGDGAGGWTFDQSLIPMATVPASDNSGNYASIWADINNDDKQDLFITHCRQMVSSSTDARRIDQIFLNNGDFTYTQDVTNTTGLRSGAQGWSTTFADYDNDGDNDALILNYDVNSEFMKNNGSGVFTNVMATTGVDATTDFFGMNVVSEDFDNDGYIDILMSGTDHRLYINNGDFTFTLDDNGMVYGTNTITSQALGDLNHDGKVDVYASYCDVYNTPSTREDKLWINNNSNGNHFINFDLNGIISNKSGIGAKIKIYGPWGIQVREIRSGEAYGINNSFTAHFGLGTTTMVDSVYIIWPSGTIDAMVNVAADQWVTVNEGSSPVSVKPIANAPQVRVYPNPTDGIVTIDLGKITNATIYIKDMSGRLVSTVTSNQRYNFIDLNAFENGVYTYEVISLEGRTSGKLVKE